MNCISRMGKLGISFGSKGHVCCEEGGPSIGIIGDEGGEVEGPNSEAKSTKCQVKKKNRFNGCKWILS